MPTRSAPLLEVKNLSIEFKTESKVIRAVDQISFTLDHGEVLGVVGESGCGKSITALSILGLIPSPPGRIVEGSIRLQGVELVGMSESEYRKIRGRVASMIFQEPMTALNPVFTIGNQMTEVLHNHNAMTRREAVKRAIHMLEVVGISSPEQRIKEYPHQLSGGMRQRVMIAMALSCSPKLLLADEPTTALDVTTQAQVMDEMSRLQQKFGMAMILITHDLGIVAQSCARVLVMYCGKIIESSPVDELFSGPKHPYTRGLLESVPVIRSQKIKRLPCIEGMVPDLAKLPVGCRYQDRCSKVAERCRQSAPELEISTAGHSAACFFPLTQKYSSGGHPL